MLAEGRRVGESDDAALVGPCPGPVVVLDLPLTADAAHPCLVPVAVGVRHPPVSEDHTSVGRFFGLRQRPTTPSDLLLVLIQPVAADELRQPLERALAQRQTVVFQQVIADRSYGRSAASSTVSFPAWQAPHHHRVRFTATCPPTQTLVHGSRPLAFIASPHSRQHGRSASSVACSTHCCSRLAFSRSH